MVYKAIDRIDTREHVKEKAFSFKVPIIFIFNKPHCWSRVHSQTICAACEWSINVKMQTHQSVGRLMNFSPKEVWFTTQPYNILLPLNLLWSQKEKSVRLKLDYQLDWVEKHLESLWHVPTLLLLPRHLCVTVGVFPDTIKWRRPSLYVIQRLGF